jgi:hypothetical protein
MEVIALSRTCKRSSALNGRRNALMASCVDMIIMAHVAVISAHPNAQLSHRVFSCPQARRFNGEGLEANAVVVAIVRCCDESVMVEKNGESAKQDSAVPRMVLDSPC